MTPRVYVLLLNWKGWSDTIECLESVFRLRYPDFRVVVCDNASPDDSLERLRGWAEGRVAAAARGGPLPAPPIAKPIRYAEYSREEAEAGGEGEGDPPLTLIRTGGNLGFAGGNNVGLRYVLARGDAAYVWLVNNDTVVDPDALAALVREAEADRSIGMVGSKLLYYDDPGVIQAVAGGSLRRWQGMTRLLGRNEPDRGQWDRAVEPDYVSGASMLVRLDTVRAVGLMDERYFLYSEEVDWCIRVRRSGERLAYCPASRVWHKEGKSVVYQSPIHDYYTVRSALLLVRKFYPYLLPVALLHSLYRCVLPKLVRLQYARLGPVLRGYRDFLQGVASSPR